MRVVVTGAAGMLGVEVVDRLASRGHDPIPLSRADLDIANPEASALIAMEKFGRLDAVINCAAYTNVDRAESEEQLATEANGLGVSYLHHACRSVGTPLIHVSTDFVFDGTANEPYDEDARTNPVSAYGRSKLAGELALAGSNLAWIVRTAWLYGARGNSFPLAIMKAHRAGKALKVVGDQVGNPTYAPELAKVLVQIAEDRPMPGVYHGVGEQIMSRHEFAGRILFALTGEQVAIEKVTSDAFPAPARRPAYGALSTARLAEAGIPPMAPVDECLNDFVSKLEL